MARVKNFATDKDLARKAGAKGGSKKGIKKGFAFNKDLARKAGAKGGRISRRGPASDYL
jgi:general stress protein YciG